MNLVDLIEHKNLIFRRFINITKSGLKLCGENRYEKLNRLINVREKLLQDLQDYDKEINVVVQNTPTLTSEEREAIVVLFKEKDEMMKEIIILDNELSEQISLQKEKISLDLKNIQKVKKSLKGYKSLGKNVE